jgi:hypothetical protein
MEERRYGLAAVRDQELLSELHLGEVSAKLGLEISD